MEEKEEEVVKEGEDYDQGEPVGEVVSHLGPRHQPGLHPLR